MNNLITKWQSLYVQKQIRDQTLEQYTASYITDKLIPMWPNGWIKFNDIQSHFMPKTKAKELKKPSNEIKSSKPLQPSNASTSVAIVVENSDKKKTHTTKESLKPMKNANEKSTLLKTDKHSLITPDRPVVPSLLSMPSGDTLSRKQV